MILNLSDSRLDLFLILGNILVFILSLVVSFLAFNGDIYRVIFGQLFIVDWIGLISDLMIFLIVVTAIFLIINLIIKIVLKLLKRQIKFIKLINIFLYSIFVFHVLAFLCVLFLECMYLIFQILRLDFNNLPVFIFGSIIVLLVWIFSIISYFYGIKVSLKK